MNFNKTRARVLFFQADAVATDEELAAMEKLAGCVVLPRNAAAVAPNERTEDADAVAGSVPEGYDHLPTVATFGEAKRLVEAKGKAKDKAPAGTPASDAPTVPKTPPGWGSGTQS